MNCSYSMVKEISYCDGLYYVCYSEKAYYMKFLSFFFKIYYTSHA